MRPLPSTHYRAKKRLCKIPFKSIITSSRKNEM